MTPYLQVHTTVATEDEAKGIARAVLERRLAACVQISGPVQSLYHWRGGLESAAEYSLVFKTRQDLLPQLMTLVLEQHPYEVPELLATPVLQGSSSYLEWLEAELAPRVGGASAP